METIELGFSDLGLVAILELVDEVIQFRGERLDSNVCRVGPDAKVAQCIPSRALDHGQPGLVAPPPVSVLDRVIGWS